MLLDPRMMRLQAQSRTLRMRFRQRIPPSAAGSEMQHNVLDYGAIGNSSYVSAGGNDDTSAIQAAIAAAVAAGGYGMVTFPGERAYRITSTISVPNGIQLMGWGQGHYLIPSQPPALVWDGSAGGTMLEVSTNAANIVGTSIDHLLIRGRNDGTNLPGCGLKYSATGGASAKLDSGSYINECWFATIAGNAIEFTTNGATNFYINGGRFDDIDEYAYYFNLNGSGRDFLCSIENQTWDHNATGMGFMFLDGETASAGSGQAVISMRNIHPEINASLTETFATGTNPYDRCGVFRLGVNPSITHTQYLLSIDNLIMAYAGGLNSFSVFQITAPSGTADAASRGAMINVTNARGINSNSTDASATSQVRMIGGHIPDTERYVHRSGFCNQFTWGRGQTFTNEMVKSSIIASDYRMRGLVIDSTTFANLPTGVTGMKMVITDCTTTTLGATAAGGGANTVEVFYRGGAWRVSAA
jgi:hypothetical protein